MSIELLSNISEKETEEFSRICNSLLAHTFILREDKTQKISKDYLYIERNFDLLYEYLMLSGWKLYKDSQYGVVYVRNIFNNNKLTLNKLPTIILIILRIIYEEKRTQASSSNHVCITVSDMLNKLVHEFSIYNKRPSLKEMKDSLKIIEEHNIIYKLGENFDDIECRIIILPSILIAVSNEKVKSICETLKTDELGDVANEENDEVIID